jgi:hypothetical protein
MRMMRFSGYEFKGITEREHLAILSGKLVGVVPQVPVDGCHFLEHFVIRADSRVLVRFVPVVTREDGRVLRRTIGFFAQILANKVAAVGAPGTSGVGRGGSRKASPWFRPLPASVLLKYSCARADRQHRRERAELLPPIVRVMIPPRRRATSVFRFA